MAKLKTPVKIGLAAVAVTALMGMGFCATQFGIIPKPAFMESKVPEATDSLAADVNRGVPRDAYDLAAQPVANFGDNCSPLYTIPWNATSALAAANGGPRTTANSLVKEFSGGCLNIERQDDYSVIQQNLIRDPAAFAIIMGDGLPAFAAGLEGKADIVVVGVVGFSDGEDKCMGKPLDGNPQNARGSTIAAVPRDGDQNICFKFAADNEIPINTDNSVYDPTAINFVDTGSFTEANDKYVAGFCEQRPVAQRGVKTGETVQVCVDGVATWTPGDVAVVANKGGLVSWASTREYNQQMPSILIANRKWAADHRAFVVGVLRAVDRAAFQIRSEPRTYLPRAAQIMANIHGGAGGDEADPNFWMTYYVGKEVTDNAGNKVSLGGSRVSTLSEVRTFLGLTPGSLNIYKGVYNIFGNYAKSFYPTIVPSFPDYDSVVTGEYVTAALAGANVTRSAAPAQFATNRSITEQVSNRSYSITFDTGRATISAASRATLLELANQTGMTNLRIQIDGHTDSVGDPASNMALSRARAQAVADWLFAQAPETFPRNRIQVRGYGDTNPVADNGSREGQSRNRRVEISLGN